MSHFTNQIHKALGYFIPGENIATGPSLVQALRRLNEPIYILAEESGYTLMSGTLAAQFSSEESRFFNGIVLPCNLNNLGDPEFRQEHGLRYAYVGGSMAKGISSIAMVKLLGQSGMLGFFGTAGLSVENVEKAIDELETFRNEFSYGFNLIHSPNEPELEEALVDLYLKKGVCLVEASAFLDLTSALVRYRTHGIRRGGDGEIIVPNRIIGKVSREEVAAKFFAPPPERLLKKLVDSGHLTAEQAILAGQIPMAQDLTVESDSGGHTDNRPALALFPTILELKESLQKQYQYQQKLRAGLGGGIGTPASAHAAFALGAAYIVTGTINQACLEAGTCDQVRQMLAETRQADVTMAPSGDMFEMGVNVQVMKRGTMFSMRAAKLYELYRAHNSLSEISQPEREKLEKTIFRKSLEEVWLETRDYFSRRDPRQISKAESNPKYKMALVFRWYLGQSPDWANLGVEDRKMDYQIWCGPAMGAFNEWTRNTFLENVTNRRVDVVAMNLLFGAAVLARANQLKSQGVKIVDESDLSQPLEMQHIKEFLN